jgi:hypothetical protein
LFFRLKFHFEKQDAFLQSYISKIVIIVVNGIAVIKVIHTVSTDAFAYSSQNLSQDLIPQSVVNASAEKRGAFRVLVLY